MRLEGETKASQLRSLHKDLGGDLTMRELATNAIDRGIWKRTQLDGAALVWAAKQCQQAMAQRDDRGLPHATPIEKGQQPRWRQLDFLDLEEANFVLQDRAGGIIADHAELVALRKFFVKQFPGEDVSSIPRLDA